jgi:hypothetical protein
VIDKMAAAVILQGCLDAIAVNRAGGDGDGETDKFPQ